MRRFPTARIPLALSVGLAVAVLAAEPASAGVTLTTTGASLRCDVYNTGRFTGYADCWLKDTRADGKLVYAVTQSEAFPVTRRTNSGSSGSTRYFREDIKGDTDTWFWSYKVCRQIYTRADNCSKWHTVYA